MKFSDMTKKATNNLLVVDGLNFAFRYKHAKKRDFGIEFLKTVQSLADSYKCGKVVITADKGSSEFRKTLYPEYKANRKEKYENQTEEEKREFEEFFTDFSDCLTLVSKHYPVLRFQGVEADDIAAYIVRRYKKDYNIWLVSSDKDWDILIDSNVSRFSYVTRKETTLENWEEHYPIQPSNYVGFKAIMGDSGDNIKGVEGIGPKRASQLLNEHTDIFTLLDTLPLPGKQKFIQNLNKAKDLLELNLQLVDILTYCEEAIGANNMKEIDNVFA
jgi:5'-3' exonuclease